MPPKFAPANAAPAAPAAKSQGQPGGVDAKKQASPAVRERIARIYRLRAEAKEAGDRAAVHAAAVAAAATELQEVLQKQRVAEAEANRELTAREIVAKRGFAAGRGVQVRK